MVPLRRVPRHHVEPLTPERARATREAVRGDRYEAAYALALCGLRASEIPGLAWADLDRGRTVVTVRYQLSGSGPKATRVQLKTAASEQPVPLPPFVTERLNAHHAAQHANVPLPASRPRKVSCSSRQLDSQSRSRG